MENFNPDYLLAAFWLIVLFVFMAIAAIIEELEKRREKNARFNGKIHNGVFEQI